jgi:hypothetical protein
MDQEINIIKNGGKSNVYVDFIPGWKIKTGSGKRRATCRQHPVR